MDTHPHTCHVYICALLIVCMHETPSGTPSGGQEVPPSGTVHLHRSIYVYMCIYTCIKAATTSCNTVYSIVCIVGSTPGRTPLVLTRVTPCLPLATQGWANDKGACWQQQGSPRHGGLLATSTRGQLDKGACFAPYRGGATRSRSGLVFGLIVNVSPLVERPVAWHDACQTWACRPSSRS